MLHVPCQPSVRAGTLEGCIQHDVVIGLAVRGCIAATPAGSRYRAFVWNARGPQHIAGSAIARASRPARWPTALDAARDFCRSNAVHKDMGQTNHFRDGRLNGVSGRFTGISKRPKNVHRAPNCGLRAKLLRQWGDGSGNDPSADALSDQSVANPTRRAPHDCCAVPDVAQRISRRATRHSKEDSSCAENVVGKASRNRAYGG